MLPLSVPLTAVVLLAERTDFTHCLQLESNSCYVFRVLR